MIDPVLRLAVAMHSSKGVYVLLLGSGVSRSSAIPTGWEVILDLIHKLAHMKGENCEQGGPEAWYKALTGSEPDYSDILDQLTMSSAERAHLLRSYFEPTEDEREQGRKAPSPAHRAIAGLVSKGYVKVIVTTNFDRLMEQALADVGVQPSVISTSDGTQGALPLTHSRCTIIKVHGDYLDHRIKNTRFELATYEKPMSDLLDHVLDEFGLLVCGWSAEWDVALRGAIERCNSHRFGTYWTDRGNLGGEAQKLVGLRRAAIIQIADADSFFRDLAEKVAALEDLALADPVSAQVAVARMKRYLAAPEQRINLHDLVNGETERVWAAVNSNRLPELGGNVTPESTLQRLRVYEGEMRVLLAMSACGGHWAADSQCRGLCRSLKRLADDPIGSGTRIVGLNLRRYPATLALYTMGISAVASGNYGLLKQIFELKIKTDQNSTEEPLTEALSPIRVFERNLSKQLLPGRELEFTPFNNYLFEVLRDSLRDDVPDDRAYDDAFDWFEYLLGLVHCDQTATPTEIEGVRSNPGKSHLWGPIGRFLWSHRTSEDGVQYRTRFEPGGPYPECVTSVLQAGFFGSHFTGLNYERFGLIKLGFDALIGGARVQTGVW
jgi:SIR2-like domain